MNLPKRAKSLLKTPRSSKDLVKSLCGGLYWYNGILKNIQPMLESSTLQQDTVSIDVFVDGMSPFKSVKKSIWPI
jgi:hypothetical protein